MAKKNEETMENVEMDIMSMFGLDDEAVNDDDDYKGKFETPYNVSCGVASILNKEGFNLPKRYHSTAGEITTAMMIAFLEASNKEELIARAKKIAKNVDKNRVQVKAISTAKGFLLDIAKSK